MTGDEHSSWKIPSSMPKLLHVISEGTDAQKRAVSNWDTHLSTENNRNVFLKSVFWSIHHRYAIQHIKCPKQKQKSTHEKIKRQKSR